MYGFGDQESGNSGDANGFINTFQRGWSESVWRRILVIQVVVLDYQVNKINRNNEKSSSRFVQRCWRNKYNNTRMIESPNIDVLIITICRHNSGSRRYGNENEEDNKSLNDNESTQ